MPTFIKLAGQADLPAENAVKEFPCGDKMICVANVNGEITALNNVCLHQGGPLGEGTIEAGKIVCPWHGWQYDPKTGEAVHNPRAKLMVYRLKVENGEVMIEI